MDRDPGDFAPMRPDADVASMSEEQFDAWMEALPPCPGLPSTEEEIAAADAEAMADYKAGQYWDHAVVGEWLKTSGRAGFKPFEEWLAQRGG